MRAWDWWGGRGQEKEHAGRNRMMRVEASSGRYYTVAIDGNFSPAVKKDLDVQAK